jgi:hypothetical protein
MQGNDARTGAFAGESEDQERKERRQADEGPRHDRAQASIASCGRRCGRESLGLGPEGVESTAPADPGIIRGCGPGTPGFV